MNADADATALDDEIALLESMYPDEVKWDRKAIQLSFKQNNSTLILRLSDGYPSSSLPNVIHVQTTIGSDIRAKVNQIVAGQAKGEPCLDAIITEFVELVERLVEQHEQPSGQEGQTGTSGRRDADKTVIIWTHHLLATGKRKLALSAASSQLRGITKPGYPGVMIFSGSAPAVEAHVQELKSQRWQAFQVRCELDETWSFGHGQGIVEVETMGELVADIEGREAQKEVFMDVMKIK